MILYWQLFAVVALVAIKENLCIPAIRPFSQRGIIFPEDNWDDCYLDKASTIPGICKSIEECPAILNRWSKQNILPKTCYFIRKEQFVCCPIGGITKEVNHIAAASSTNKPDLNNELTTMISKMPTFTENLETTKKEKPFNIFLSILKTTTEKSLVTMVDPTKRPSSNIFLDKVMSTDDDIVLETSTNKIPSNIFLDKVTENKGNDSIKGESTAASKNPAINTAVQFSMDTPANVTKRRSELACDLRNSLIAENNGPLSTANEFPFMVAVGWKLNDFEKIWYACGGVLISPSFVLTAGQCTDIEGEKPLYVRLGDKNLADDTKTDIIRIKQIIKYPGYNNINIYKDIALMELEGEVKNPIACLWAEHNLPFSQLNLLGFGHRPFDGLGPNQLRKSIFTIVEEKDCQQAFENADKLKKINISQEHLCAGDLENLNKTCHGESGSPLMMEFEKIAYVVGITSLDLGCSNLPPSVFTRVSTYIDWIEDIVWPKIDVRFDK